MRKNNELTMPGRTTLTTRFILVFASMATALVITSNVYAQLESIRRQVIRQVAAPLPKLALNGAVAETKGGVQYHRIVLMITNWEKYASEMFVVPAGQRMSSNPCAGVGTRVVIAVYSERGAALSRCIPVPQPADLAKFSFLIQKGKSVPDFVYVVIHDRHTGGAYRSNLVSPLSGQIK